MGRDAFYMQVKLLFSFINCERSRSASGKYCQMTKNHNFKGWEVTGVRWREPMVRRRPGDGLDELTSFFFQTDAPACCLDISEFCRNVHPVFGDVFGGCLLSVAFSDDV